MGNSDVVIYNFRLEIVEQLLIAGHEVFISSPYGRRIDDLIRLGCRYEKTKISRHGKNPFEDIRLLHSYKDLLRRIKPDIVFTYTIKPIYMAELPVHKCAFHMLPISRGWVQP